MTLDENQIRNESSIFSNFYENIMILLILSRNFGYVEKYINFMKN